MPRDRQRSPVLVFVRDKNSQRSHPQCIATDADSPKTSPGARGGAEKPSRFGKRKEDANANANANANDVEAGAGDAAREPEKNKVLGDIAAEVRAGKSASPTRGGNRFQNKIQLRRG